MGGAQVGRACFGGREGVNASSRVGCPLICVAALGGQRHARESWFSAVCDG